MSELLLQFTQRNRYWSLAIVVAVLFMAALVGITATNHRIVLPVVAGVGVFVLLQRPRLGLLLIMGAALVFPIKIATGSEVNLNPATILIPAIAALWLLDMARKRDVSFVRSRTFWPLFLLLISGTVSLIVGNATWEPLVPRPQNFLLVQMGQLAIFFLAGAAYLLVSNLVNEEVWLKYLVWMFLAIAGGLALLLLLPVGRTFVSGLATEAYTRAPFWMLLTAVAGGQLLFNKRLAPWQRVYLGLILVAVGHYALVLHREVISIWIGIAAAAAMLLWLRLPRMRWILLVLLLVLFFAGILFPVAYEFAGGDAEWRLSGVSRLDLSMRVLQVTERNPITGLGPASYRVYASIDPLVWRGGSRIWTGANVSSHNNYVDIYSQFGLLGLVVFLWFMAEIALLGLRLHRSFRSGFTSGYVNGALAIWAGALVLMLLADWILPFVYNIGFPGFQASVFVWLFLGGLVAISKFEET